MSDAKPTTDELTEALAKGMQLLGATNVEETDYAVFVFGTNAWVCPHCLDVKNVSKRLAIETVHCDQCGAMLQP